MLFHAFALLAMAPLAPGAWLPERAAQDPAQAAPIEDARVAALLERAAKESANDVRDEAARWDALLFELGTLPALAPRALFAAWQRAEGDLRCVLALALQTCADAEIVEALANALLDEHLSDERAYVHLVACARALAIEASLPSLHELRAKGQRARIAEDLRRANAAARGAIARARTNELLALLERVEASGINAPAATRALLELAIGLCGRVAPERALEFAQRARAQADPALRQALWLALAYTCNRSFLAGRDRLASSAPSAEEISAALAQAEAFLAERAEVASESWVEEGLAAQGFAWQSGGAERVASLLEAAEAGDLFARYHALRLLAAEAGMRPDLELVFFPERARRHPTAAVQPPAAREAALRSALRRWAEEHYAELRR
ncbi:MAG: hypothetical protein JNM84_26590 [Planctomycetes bacterium]|nr:hypothetical protein [Planctomycetota bacterium]